MINGMFKSLWVLKPLSQNMSIKKTVSWETSEIADKPQMRWKYLPSPMRGRGTAASAVVDEVAKNNDYDFYRAAASALVSQTMSDNFLSKRNPRKNGLWQ